MGPGFPAGTAMAWDGLAAELPAWAWPPSPSAWLEPAARPRTDDVHPAHSPFVWQASGVVEPTTGPLAGLRLAVKDLVAVAGRPCRAGSASRQSVPPERQHAPLVARLLDGGAHLVGTTKLHEFGFGVTGINRFEGMAPNPAAPAAIPGGSSSGSASAVALGLADVAIGTDTGGSCRIPAALCGVVGYKPSRRLGCQGVFPLAPTLDHLGWCTASVATARWGAEAAGLLDGPPVAPSRRIGVLSAALGDSAPEVAGAVAHAVDRLRGAGFIITDLDWPHAPLVHAVTTTIMFAEAARVHLGSLEGYGDDVRARIERGRTVTATAYLAALSLKDQLAEAFGGLIDGYDAILSPTTAIAAPRPGDAESAEIAAALVRYTRLDNLTGFPAISLPLPQTASGPVGLHVTGRSDRLLLDCAASVEAVISRTR
jgi:Asp-tRNA(Asn)/Glu-tRNA(Gln) amidotransferase A subunit family amidase